MPAKNPSQVFSAGLDQQWRPLAPSIWTPDGRPSREEAAFHVARLLLDQPRWLEPWYLYDECGSELFERICELPEYYLTRAEESILTKHAEAIIRRAGVECIVELGAGFSRKTSYLLRAQSSQRQESVYVPVDVSLRALAASREAVEGRFPAITFQGLCARYEEGIVCIDRKVPTLFAFLGSSVGNFTRSEFVRFFQQLAGRMGAHDYFLLGIDRIKDVAILERAYNDSQGVTANFILNVFNHVNRLAGTHFDQAQMRYYSWYNQLWQQVEMYAVSTSTQEIHFPTLRTSFVWEKGDRILVEISRKFDPAELARQLQAFRLQRVEHFTDSRQWFSLMLFRKICA